MALFFMPLLKTPNVGTYFAIKHADTIFYVASSATTLHDGHVGTA
jgi:hypothetical protein